MSAFGLPNPFRALTDDVWSAQPGPSNPLGLTDQAELKARQLDDLARAYRDELAAGRQEPLITVNPGSSLVLSRTVSYLPCPPDGGLEHRRADIAREYHRALAVCLPRSEVLLSLRARYEDCGGDIADLPLP